MVIIQADLLAMIVINGNIISANSEVDGQMHFRLKTEKWIEKEL